MFIVEIGPKLEQFLNGAEATIVICFIAKNFIKAIMISEYARGIIDRVIPGQGPTFYP